MESAALALVSYQGSSTTKDGALVKSSRTGAYASGTGKLKGIRGQGTFSCAPAGDSMSCDSDGDYGLGK